MDIVIDCGSQLLHLIDDLLDFSRIETGKLKIKYQTFDLTQMLRSIEEIFKLRFNQKNLYFKFNDSGIEQPVYSDEKHIRQIIINLIDNAFKFTHSGGVIVTSTVSNHMLMLSVADTSCGIPEEMQPFIFKPFTQVNTDGEFTHQGIGLGLSITLKLVEQLGGTITLESHPKKGSEFIVEIPLDFYREKQPARKSSHHLEFDNSVKVLLAEDNKTNQLLILNQLEQMNCTVQLANNGKQALILLKQNFYELALIDLNMPVMNGLSLIKAIRANETLNAKIKAIAISAYADDIKRQSAFSAGFNEYLPKPFSLQDLKRIIQVLMNMDEK